MTVLAVALLFAAQGHGGEKAFQAPTQKSPPAPTKSAANGSAPGSPRNDHVGKPLPDYMTGDQCLFCHRNVVGPTWEQEPHAWTIRPVGIEPQVPSVPQLPKDATHVVGSAKHYRALKQIGYGKFAILANDGKIWQPDVFATQCAGCHTTGVDPSSHTFSAYAFDCYACHGDLTTDHTTNWEPSVRASRVKSWPSAASATCAADARNPPGFPTPTTSSPATTCLPTSRLTSSASMTHP